MPAQPPCFDAEQGGCKVPARHRTCGPSKLASRLLATGSLACLAPLSRVRCHPPQGTLSHPPLSVRWMQAVFAALLFFGQNGRLWAMRAFQKYVLSLPFDSCGRNKNISKADREDKIPYLNRRAKEVEYESLHH